MCIRDRGTGTPSDGVATFTVSAISGGAHSYSAAYSGYASFVGYAGSSSSAVLVTAQPVSTTTALSASSTSATTGSSVTLTAATSPSADAGPVTFFDGVNTLGSATVSGGVATFTIDAIAVGTHSYTAAYGGDVNYLASTSPALEVTAKTTTTTTLSASTTDPAIGSSVIAVSYTHLILHKVGARFWIGRVMITWGLVSVATAFTRGPISFCALRFLLGLAEACLLYTSRCV